MRVLLMIVVCASGALAQNPQIFNAVNAGDASLRVGASSSIVVNGGDLSRSSCTSTTSVSPLCGLTLTANGAALQLMSVNQTQISAIAPSAPGTYTLQATSNAHTSNVISLTVAASGLAFVADHGVIT